MPIPAALHDLEDILSLFRLCRNDLLSQGLTQWDETYPDKTIFFDDITQGHTYLKRDPDGQLIAYFTMNTKDDLQWALKAYEYAPPEHALLLHRLCIHPGYQHQGIGRLCMHFAEQQAHRLGYHALLLTVFKQNKRAVSFYQTLGYQPCGALLFEENGDLGLTMYKAL